jgi:hypothetical protein
MQIRAHKCCRIYACRCTRNDPNVVCATVLLLGRRCKDAALRLGYDELPTEACPRHRWCAGGVAAEDQLQDGSQPCP